MVRLRNSFFLASEFKFWVSRFGSVLCFKVQVFKLGAVGTSMSERTRTEKELNESSTAESSET